MSQMLFFNFGSGYSAAWLAHLLWEQRVVGSNPATPTILKKIKLSFKSSILSQLKHWLDLNQRESKSLREARNRWFTKRP